jgi:AcrR family transcriptional regulator
VSQAEVMTERQRRVLDAAMEVFAERGYAAASTAEIASRAEVAEGTIFKRFKTKKDLLLGVLGPYLVELGAPGVLRAIETVVGDPQAGLPELVEAVVRDRLEFVRRNPMVVRILLQEVPLHPELRDAVVGTMATRMLPSAWTVIEHLQKRGEIDSRLPIDSVVRIMTSVLAGYVVARLVALPDHGWDDDREIEIMTGVLRRGLAPV